MTWILLSLCAALFSSFRDIYVKRSTKKFDSTIIATAQVLYAIPLLSATVYLEGIPELNGLFVLYLLLGATFSTAFLYLYNKAISLSDVSLVLPLVSASPLFLIVLSPFLLSEYNRGIGVWGVLFICLGVYILGVKKGSRNLLSPVSHLFSDKGCQRMLLASLCAAFAVSFEKNGVKNSSATFFALAYVLVDSIALLVILKCQRNSLKPLLSDAAVLFPLGCCLALILLCQAHAYTSGPATYVIALKRLGALFTVLIGCFFLKEGRFKTKLLAVVMLLLGAFLISVGGIDNSQQASGSCETSSYAITTA